VRQEAEEDAYESRETEPDAESELAGHDGEEKSEEGGHGEGGLSLPSLIAPIASLQTGQTTSSQPVLCWYISAAWPEKIELTLNEYGVTEPILEKQLDGPAAEGIYEINLADDNITLRPNIEYEWFLVIVPDPRERSADFLGSATIMYVEPSAALSERLSNTPEHRLYHVYAEAGYWYDAIVHLSRLIRDRPDDKSLREHRITLFDQVKLGKVMNYDKNLISVKSE